LAVKLAQTDTSHPEDACSTAFVPRSVAHVSSSRKGTMMFCAFRWTPPLASCCTVFNTATSINETSGLGHIIMYFLQLKFICNCDDISKFELKQLFSEFIIPQSPTHIETRMERYNPYRNLHMALLKILNSGCSLLK
jgi:hypothetical protein